MPSSKPQRSLGRAVRWIVHLQLRRGGRHRGGEGRLRRRRRHIEQRDGVAPECFRRIVVGGQPADLAWLNRREKSVQAPGKRPGICPGARHHEIVLQRVDAHAQTLLHVGHLRLGLENAARRVHDREDAAGHRHHDGRRHQQLDQRKAVFLPQHRSCHCDFLVLTVMSRASSRSRRVDPTSLSAVPRLRDLVTTTCRITVLFGFVGNGSTDQRRM